MEYYTAYERWGEGGDSPQWRPHGGKQHFSQSWEVKERKRKSNVLQGKASVTGSPPHSFFEGSIFFQKHQIGNRTSNTGAKQILARQAMAQGPRTGPATLAVSAEFSALLSSARLAWLFFPALRLRQCLCCHQGLQEYEKTKHTDFVVLRVRQSLCLGSRGGRNLSSRSLGQCRGLPGWKGGSETFSIHLLLLLTWVRARPPGPVS